MRGLCRQGPVLPTGNRAPSGPGPDAAWSSPSGTLTWSGSATLEPPSAQVHLPFPGWDKKTYKGRSKINCSTWWLNQRQRGNSSCKQRKRKLPSGKPLEKSKTKTQIFEVEFDKKISLNKLQKISGVSKIEAKGESWIISSENENDLRILISQFAAKNNLLILTLQKHSDNLEDIFKKLTK